MACVLSTFVPHVPAAAQAAPGEIHGTVVDDTTGKPVAGVTVTAASVASRASTTSAKDGTYAIIGLAQDTYNVTFELKNRGAYVVRGVTVLGGEPVTVNGRLLLRTLATVRVRGGLGSAFTPAETSNTYTFSNQQITAIQGKDFNSNETSLLRSLPSITLDKTGTISVRGGYAFEAAYEYEGIDYTTPTPNLQNTLQNVSNFNLINGVGGVTLVPGGGEASHGNTGTGLIEFTAKRGTYPGTYGLDVEAGAFPYDHQAAVEFGYADPKGRFSNYFAYLGENRAYQYGLAGTTAASLGTRGTNAASLGSLVDPNLIYFSPADQASRDFVDNFFFRFGKQQTNQLQFFFQGQAIKQDLDYGGFANLAYPTAGGGVFVGATSNSGVPGVGSSAGLCPKTFPGGVVNASLYACQNLLPLYPTQFAAYSNVTSPDRLYSPFQAYKLEYQNTSFKDTLIGARVYRTFTTEHQELPSQGIFAPDYGGYRSAASAEVTRQIDRPKLKQTVEIGGMYEFVHPVGSILNVADYGSLTSGINAATSTIAPLYYYNEGLPSGPTGNVTEDFYTPAACAAFATTSGANCGYLSKYLAAIPRFPAILTQPIVNQQVYGFFAQDLLSIGARSRLHVTPGLRYEGYNFQIPSDPASPPSINGVAHQRVLEPHLGTSYLLTAHDAIRANFAHTLSIPLPSLLGNSVDRGQYAAFAKIPSFDNLTGAPATYCGLTKSSPCANYADQLYWLSRDYLFGAQPNTTALHGATFTNYDFSYEHDFPNALSLKISPFYRRGYDVVEQTDDPIGLNPRTGAPLYPLTPVFSNRGLERSTGVEFEVTRQVDPGISALLSATYINQIGNQPPGAFLTSTALDAGQLFHSPNLSPFQTTLALTYKNRSGLRINPVFSFNVGYPYGAGANVAAICNGTSAVVPNTNLTSGQTYAPTYVDPEDPGTCSAPNVAATRGNVEPASPGGYLSRMQFNTDLTIEYAPPATRSTFGLQITNLFDQLYATPVFNSCYGAIVATGVSYGNAPCSYATVFNSGPAPNAYPTGPYNVYPNEQPISARFYYELKL